MVAVRLGRFRIRPPAWWAWLILALAPTLGYLLAEAIIEWRTK
jgi:hypothetical protein